MAEASPTGKATPYVLSRVATITAVALLAAYVLVVGLQWFNVGASDVDWNRRQTLLTGLEALAFAGAGALFGTTVQRQVTKKAEDQAAAAEQTARSAQRDAEKGRALHAAIAARAGTSSAQGTDSERGDVERGRAPAPSGSAYDDLLAIAQQYDEQ